MARRVEVDLSKVPWVVLPAMLEAAGAIYEEAKAEKGRSGVSVTGPAPKRGKLRDRDPW